MATVNASSARFRHTFLQRELGDEGWGAVLQRLSEEDRDAIAAVGRGAKVPAGVEGRLLEEALSQLFGTDRTSAERFLRRGGSGQAEDMLDGVFSVFARFVSPQQALSRAPAILGAAYGGVNVGVDVDGAAGGVLTVEGLGDFSYAGPWICGWIERAGKRFGAPDPQAVERSWERGIAASPRLEFVIRWG